METSKTDFFSFLRVKSNWVTVLIVTLFLALPFYALDGTKGVAYGVAGTVIQILATILGCFVIWNIGVHDKLRIFLGGVAFPVILFSAYGLTVDESGHVLRLGGDFLWSLIPFLAGGFVIGFLVTFAEKERYPVWRGLLMTFLSICFMTFSLGATPYILGRITIKYWLSVVFVTGLITCGGTFLGFYVGKSLVTPGLREFGNIERYLKTMAMPVVGFMVMYFLLTFLFALIYWGTWTLNNAAFNHPKDAPINVGSFLYFSVVTIATVGYGDITPASAVAKWIVGLEVIAGIGLITVVFAAVLAYLQPRFEEITRKIRDEAAEQSQG